MQAFTMHNYALFSLLNQNIIILNSFNPFQPEFTSVIFIHYKPRIAVAILDL